MFAITPQVKKKIVTWAQNDFENRLIVPHPAMADVVVPPGVRLTEKKIHGKKNVIRNRRIYSNQKLYHATWPELGLHELRIPKLVCVLSGQTDFRTGEYIVTCGEGHFILLPPFTPHTTGGQSHLEGENRKNGFCEIMQILIFQDSIYCISCSSHGEEHITNRSLNQLVSHLPTVQLFQLFTEEALQENADFEICSHLLSAFFMQLFRNLNAKQLENFVPDNPLTFQSDDMLQNLRNYIKTHIHEHLTIEQMAHKMHMSPSQFTRFLRRETGQSFVDILTEYRMERAKTLLVETQWTIKYVADTVGYNSPTYFNALFLREVGCSPGTYRKNPELWDKNKKQTPSFNLDRSY
jgi:AraC-like DNA-binding protein